MRSLFRRTDLAPLLKFNLAGCVLIFALLQIWRPCYFLTDDNLSSLYPVFTEMGRHLKSGQSPFISDYLFGGHYDLSRDIGYLYWHPFYLGPALLSDTAARFWMMDSIAFLFLIFTTLGFTLLAHVLRRENNPTLANGYLAFFTFSYVFSAYALYVGSSWINCLGNESALPWLVLGLLERRLLLAIALVAAITIHQMFGAYAALTLSNCLLLSLLALGLSICRRSIKPLFIWGIGNAVGFLLISPLLLHEVEGFVHSTRVIGLSTNASSELSIPAFVVAPSFFLGTWVQPFAVWAGDPHLASLVFPYVSSLLACAAAWCLVPALAGTLRWRPLEVLCLAMAAICIVLVIRPDVLTQVMRAIPFLRSMRWPFRESLQLLFFFHLFLVLRVQAQTARLLPFIAAFSLAIFLLPLPFIHPPTFNSLPRDRQVLFDGSAEKFWSHARNSLHPGDEIVTIIDPKLWKENVPDIPYTILGTANFPDLFRVTSASGYSTTAPSDQLPIKIMPAYWFGAFHPSQVKEVLTARPDVVLVTLESVHPFRIAFVSKNRPSIEFTPFP